MLRFVLFGEQFSYVVDVEAWNGGSIRCDNNNDTKQHNLNNDTASCHKWVFFLWNRWVDPIGEIFRSNLKCLRCIFSVYRKSFLDCSRFFNLKSVFFFWFSFWFGSYTIARCVTLHVCGHFSSALLLLLLVLISFSGTSHILIVPTVPKNYRLIRSAFQQNRLPITPISFINAVQQPNSSSNFHIKTHNKINSQAFLCLFFCLVFITFHTQSRPQHIAEIGAPKNAHRARNAHNKEINNCTEIRKMYTIRIRILCVKVFLLFGNAIAKSSTC